MPIMSSQAYERFFEETIEIRSVLIGAQELPPFPGKKSGPWYRLYLILQAAILLLREEPEAARDKLAQVDLADQPMRIEWLVELLLSAETGSLEFALDQVSSVIEGIESGASKPLDLRPKAAYAYDFRLARRWAYVLRLFLTSRLPEITPEHITRCRHDLAAAREAGMAETTLLRMDFLIRISLARQLRSVDQVLVAARDWQELCRDHPEYGSGLEYHLEAILALEFDNRFTEALDWIEESLPQVDELYEILAVKARILKRIGRIEESLLVSEFLIERYPHDFAGYTLRSNAHFLLGDNEKAMADAQLAVTMDPDNPNSYLARAFVLLQIGNYKDALVDFEKTLELDPLRYDAMRGQGKCLSMLGHDFAALESFQRLRRTYPDDPEVYYEIADVLFAAGYLDDCEKACRECLRLDSSFVSAYVILGMIAMRRNEDDKARHLLNKAVAMEPDNPFALNELSYLSHLDGDEDRAIELVNRAIAESPDYADALCNKGIIHYFRSEFDQANQVFEQTLRLMPDHVGALVGKANTLVQLNEFDEANRLYDAALILDPDNLDACHGKIMLYRMLGLDDEVRYWQDKAGKLELEEDEEAGD